MMTFLGGLVNGFASPTLVELTHLEDERLRFNTTYSDIFGVSLTLHILIYWNIIVSNSLGIKKLLCNHVSVRYSFVFGDSEY